MISKKKPLNKYLGIEFHLIHHEISLPSSHHYTPMVHHSFSSYKTARDSTFCSLKVTPSKEGLITKGITFISHICKKGENKKIFIDFHRSRHEWYTMACHKSSRDFQLFFHWIWIFVLTWLYPFYLLCSF